MIANIRFALAFSTTALCAPLGAQTLVVSNMGNTTAQLIDSRTGRVLATLPTTSVPHEAAVSPDGKLAIITDYGSQQPGNTLTLIDIASRSVLRTISFAPYQRPHGATFLRDNQTLVVTAERDSLLVMINVTTGSIIRTLRTGQRLGHLAAIPADQRTAYVANVTGGTLSIVDLVGSAEPVVIKVGTQTEGIGVSPDGRWVWMGSNNTGKVFVIDAAARQVIDSIQTPGTPYRIGFTPDSKTAIVTNPLSDEIRIFDVATRALRTVVNVHPEGGGSATPQGIAITPKGDRAWVTLGGTNRVIELDIASAKVLNSWATAAGPDGIALSPLLAPKQD